MAHVTNLKVAFRKTVQPRDYESETAEVEFSVALEDDDAELANEMAADVLDGAKDQVYKALGLKPKARDKTR